MENKLTLSVIIPMYNAELYIDKCISSVVHQTWTDMEIIIIDDGSVDESLQICRNWAKKDKRIVLLHKKNEGLVETRKIGVAMATGQYLTFIDADDWIDSNAYEIAMSKLRMTSDDILLFGLVEEYGEHCKKQTNLVTEGRYIKEDIVQKIYPNILSNDAFFHFGILPNLVCKIFRREIINSAQKEVDSTVQIGEDLDASIKAIFKADSIMITNFAPYHYRKHQDSMMVKSSDLCGIKALFNDLENTFRLSSHWDVLFQQLEKYELFLMCLKQFEYIWNKSFLKQKIMNKKIAIYGAGGFGQEVHRTISKDGSCRITVWVDKNYEYYQKKGMRIMDVHELYYSEFDILFIAILDTSICENIKESLVNSGIEQSKIVYIEPIEENIRFIQNVLQER